MLPCQNRLDEECFRHNPQWAKQALAYRLVHLLTPKQLTRRLPKFLRMALIAPGLVMPPGLVLPPGTVVAPGTILPPAWTPGDPAPTGVTIPPGTSFPAGWTPGDPLPEGVILDPGATIPDGWTPPDPIPDGLYPPPYVAPETVITGPTPPPHLQNPSPRRRPCPGAPEAEPGCVYDLLDEEFVVVTAWSDDDFLNGVSTDVTYDDKSCLYLFSGAPMGVAARSKDIGSFTGIVCCEFNVYFQVLGGFQQDDLTFVINGPGTDQFAASLSVWKSGADWWGLTVFKSGVLYKVDEVTTGEWQTWKFVVDFSTSGSPTVDIYFNGDLKAEGISCDIGNGVGNGIVSFSLLSAITGGNRVYVDYVKVGSWV